MVASSSADAPKMVSTTVLNVARAVDFDITLSIDSTCDTGRPWLASGQRPLDAVRDGVRLDVLARADHPGREAPGRGEGGHSVRLLRLRHIRRRFRRLAQLALVHVADDADDLANGLGRERIAEAASERELMLQRIVVPGETMPHCAMA